MEKRTMDEMISFFNQEVSKMDISQENKMKLLGIITAIGYENKKQEVVRCKDCIHACKDSEEEWCERMPWKALDPNWFCADGERR